MQNQSELKKKIDGQAGHSNEAIFEMPINTKSTLTQTKSTPPK